MKNFKKLIISFGLACSISFANIQAYADWTNSVYEEKEEEYIAKGVKHEHLLKFTDEGWLNINILRINLDENDASLDLLFNENGLNQKGKLSEFVNQRENIVGAVNGDFFSMKGAATIGPMVKDGKLFTTTFHLSEKVPTFNLSKYKEPFIINWTNPKITLKNENTDFSFDIYTINKETNLDNTAVLYTPEWGEKTPPFSQGLKGIEIIIEDDIVKAIVPAFEGSYIPKNGYVILATGQKAFEIGSNFVCKDKVSFSLQTNPDFKELALSIGGGAYIVKEGKVQSDFHINIKGNHPRTAIGISKDKKEVFFVTIDGRTSSYTGVTQEELGEIMISLGAYDAINLDGGGSTDMVLRPLGEEKRTVINNPSGGSERRIMNGIGIISTASKTSELGGIILESEESNILIDTMKKLILKGYDKNYNPVEIDYDQVNWHVSGIYGKFYKDSFKATTAGEGIIVAEYEGKYATLPIRVIDNPVRLEVSPSKINIDKNKGKFIKVKVVDEDGYGAYVSLSDLDIEIPDNLGEIDDKDFFVAKDKSGSGIMKISYKNITSYVPVVVGSREVIVDDFENTNGTFLSYPADVFGSYNLSSFSKAGNYSGEISYDFTKTDATRAAYLVFDNGGINFDKRPKKLGMWVYGNGSGHMLKAKCVYDNGAFQNIPITSSIDWEGWKFVEASIPSGLKAPFKLERIYVVETSPLLKDAGKIYIDQLTAFYPNTFDGNIPKEQKIIDSRNTKAKLEGQSSFRLIAYGEISGIDSSLDSKIADISNKDKGLNLFTQSIDQTLKEKLQNPTIMVAGGYASTRHKNSLFIQLDNSQGSLRETNFEQWRWFLEKIENVDSHNVFISLPKPLYFKDKLEEKLFKDILKKLKEEKSVDVWVLTGGHDNYSVYPKDGIRYVELKSYKKDMDISEELKYIRFTVNDDKVTYEILPLYEKES
ncbi:phosphodiester glycosidase family protein [Crassaminicella thermophila]|uniref:Phosphodiester glycosidase family protein n=1 Tax=Crassaminicella thermophila TaxID=2599308 RepID=A0A5C0SDV6_CRATE|nr:phosphodiester glycosidase family protein [Crassaminicella thermophila]QEK11444.1 phosphodiester glycosidase family protein [Crassaminicella thermophila]